MVFRKFLKQWFGYTRGERAGSFILLIILLVVLVIRALNSGGTSTLKEGGMTETISADSAAAGITDRGGPLTVFRGYDNDIDRSGSTDSLNTGIAAGDNEAVAAVTGQGYLDSLYVFDPNTASQDKLLGLGLSERQVRTIINYRNTGARFYEPEDFRKIYGIDREMQDRLLPCIVIRELEGQERSDGLASINKKPVKAGEQHSMGLESKLDLNRADSADFERLEGIGPVLAGRIVKYRKLLGYFSCPSQLSEVYGLSTEVTDIHSHRFTCDSLLVRKININRASYSDMLRHPYISRFQVEALISYRKLSGPVSSMQELIRNRIFNRTEGERLKPYIEFE